MPFLLAEIRIVLLSKLEMIPKKLKCRGRRVADDVEGNLKAAYQ